MRKILTLLLCINFIHMSVCFAITDDFVNATLDNNLKIKTQMQPQIIDEFANATLNKDLKIRQINYSPIIDYFAQENKNKNTMSRKTVDFNEVLPKAKTSEPIKRKVVFIDEENAQSVFVRIKKDFTTKSKAQEGDIIEFETTKDVVINKKNFPSGTTVNARIETISLNKAMGVPSDLVVGSFNINGIPLAGEITKTGANRAIWLYPAVCAGSVFFFAGLLLTPIRGGHAKIKTSQIYELYAH